MTIEQTIDSIAERIKRYRYPIDQERRTQDKLERVLLAEGITFEREKTLGYGQILVFPGGEPGGQRDVRTDLTAPDELTGLLPGAILSLRKGPRLVAAEATKTPLRVSPTDGAPIRPRIDFLVKHDGHSIGVELKLRESRSDMIRQLYWYSQCKDVDGLLLVTTSMQLTTITGPEWPKPLRVLHLASSVL